MTTARTTVCVLLVCVLFIGQADGGSIWAKAQNGRTVSSIYQDDKAHGIGDVLTIRIGEKATVVTKKSRTDSKDNSSKGSGSGQVDFGDVLPQINRLGFGKPFTLPNWNYEGTTGGTLKSTADHKNEQTYTDYITVVVEDVMPNGNLLVLGKRTREVGGNTQVIQASGIVRPSDVDETNMIYSSRVANFHVVYSSHGPENNFMRDGWMMRIWRLINPF